MIDLLLDIAPPLNLSATGTTVGGYILAAASAGVGILAGLYGVRVIVSAFKSVGGGYQGESEDLEYRERDADELYGPWGQDPDDADDERNYL